LRVHTTNDNAELLIKWDQQPLSDNAKRCG